MQRSDHILKLDGEPSKRLGEVMGSAFLHRLGFQYILPDDHKRAEALPWFFGSFLRRIAQRKGEVYATRDESGGAFWIRPDAKITYMDAIQAGLITMPFQLGLGGFRRALHLNKVVDHVHASKMREPHWYLIALAVAPERQGEGLGGALMAPAFQMADTNKQPCYLETFTEDNLDYYRRFGFEVVVRACLEDIPFWGMKRAPKG